LCRVLHISANKVNIDRSNQKIDLSVSFRPNYASVFLPSIAALGSKSESRLDEAVSDENLQRDRFSSNDIIRQIYVKNCALCVLSRFGVIDDVFEANKTECNLQFIEAVHLSGANTIIYPLWGANGIGILANLLFFIRFYSILSSKSKVSQLIKNRYNIIQFCYRKDCP
jgi:hypothetical protein